MIKRLCLLLLPAVFLLHGEVIDRIAVKAGKEVITGSAVLLEIRLTAFLNGEEPSFSPESRRKTAERMVDQILIRKEMEMSQYPLPDSSEAGPLLEQVKREYYPGGSAYQDALRKYGVSEAQLRDYLLKQVYTLRFIDIRFRPGFQVPEPEVRQYYEKQFLPEWQNRNSKPAPPLEEVREKVEEILVRQRVNGLVENWIKEARGRMRIEFMEKAFE